MQIVTGRRGEPHVTSRQMQAVYRSFLGDFALLDIGEKLRAEAYSDDIVRVYDGVVSVQGIYAVIAYNQYDEVYIEPVSVGKKRIDTIVLHYTKDNTLDVEDMQLDVVQGDEYTDNPIAPVVPEGGDAWEGTTDIQVPIYDVEVTSFGLTVTPYVRMLTVIPTLESIAERIPETFVTGVKGDSEVLYRDGDVNITKANIGLGNVDNTADTDKPVSTATQTALNLKADLTYVDAKIAAAYHAGGSKTVAELTSALLIADNMGKVYNMSDSGVTTSDFVEGAGEPINEGDNVGICNVGTEEIPIYKFDLLSGFVDLSAYATTSAVNAGLEGKVDKVEGKGLSTEDYTTTDKTKLAGISEGATQTIANPADTATETLSKLEVGGVVYDIPQGASGATELSELTDVNLSNVEDNDILQYDETANKWKNSNALQGSKTATGNPITVTDAAPVNAVNLSMDLEPIQEGSGTPSPDNIRPISGRSEVAIDRVGVNLYPITVGEDYWDNNADGTHSNNNGELVITVNNNYSGVYSSGTNNILRKTCLALSNFTISADVKASVNMNVKLSNVEVQLTTSYQRLTFGASTMISIYGTGTAGTIYVKNLQLELGSTATEYEPYVGKTYTIQFGQTVYGGTLDVTRGKMVVDRGYYTTTWGNCSAATTLGNNTRKRMPDLTNEPSSLTYDTTTISNIAPYLQDFNSDTAHFYIQPDKQAYIFLPNNTSDSTVIQVCYDLATPITIPLTPQQIKLLENTNTVYTDYEGDTIHIEYQPNNAIGEAVRVVEESYDAIIQNLIDRITALENS